MTEQEPQYERNDATIAASLNLNESDYKELMKNASIWFNECKQVAVVSDN
jgi:hypothetical protein